MDRGELFLGLFMISLFIWILYNTLSEFNPEKHICLERDPLTYPFFYNVCVAKELYGYYQQELDFYSFYTLNQKIEICLDRNTCKKWRKKTIKDYNTEFEQEKQVRELSKQLPGKFKFAFQEQQNIFTRGNL